MIMVVYSKDETLLEGFKFGLALNSSANFTRGVGERGFWLLIENDDKADNHTYELTKDHGLVHVETGVEV